MQSYTCPNCGAPVKMDDHGAFLECPYCGSQFKPDDSLSDEPSIFSKELLIFSVITECTSKSVSFCFLSP